jgi:hypothetical protein
VVTRDYLQSVLRVDQGTAKNFLAPLKIHGLIDENGKPTQLANDWRTDDLYADACQQMLRRAYPQAVLDAFPGPAIDLSAVRAWFMRNMSVGENAAYKRASMYALLHQADPSAGVRVAQASGSLGTDEPRAKGGLRRAGQSPPHFQNRSPNNGAPTDPLEVTAEPLAPMRDVKPNLVLNIHIHLAADTSAEQADHIFASMSKHLWPRA